MSDTDDTDVLLLIPPDFFLVHSDSEESYNEKAFEHCDPHCSVVDSLISQVYNLENRINQIENNSEAKSLFSSISSSNSTLIPISTMSEDNYYHGSKVQTDNYIPSSTKSTPQKQKTKFVLSSLPATPPYKYRRPLQRSRLYTKESSSGNVNSLHQNTDADESNLSVTPEKIDKKEILGEIDKFLNSVKTIQTAKLTNTNDKKCGLNATNIQISESPVIKFDNPAITLSELTTMEESNKRFSDLNLKDVNRLLEAIESQQELMDRKSDTKIEALFENKSFNNTSKESSTYGHDEEYLSNVQRRIKQSDYSTETMEQSKSTWTCGSNENSVPNLGYGMRSNMYSDKGISEEFMKNNSPAQMESIPLNIGKPDSQSDSDSTDPTVLETRSNKPIDRKQYIQATSSSSNYVNKLLDSMSDYRSVNNKYIKSNKKSGNESKHVDGLKSLPTNLSTISLQPTCTDMPSTVNNSVANINLFSLADIWSSSNGQSIVISENEMKKLLPKLEEERCRRKHCEKLINELQMKILEMQQRLAVAIQVDSAKDEAILRFHEAWEKVANRWKNLESERNNLSKKILSIEEKSSQNILEANKKANHYETEVSKALEIAEKNQQKCKILEKERAELLKKLKDLGIQIKSSQEHINEVTKHKEQLANRVSQLENESSQTNKLLLEAQSEISKSKTSFLSAENELISLKEDYIKIQDRLKQEQATIYELESQNNNLNISLESLQKNEQKLQKEMKMIKDESERTKVELRNFYQQQVEILVKDKLKEFQQQLEQAEKSLQEELNAREQSISRQAAKQLQKLTEKHKLEIQLIEEKHKEETRLYVLKTNQMTQQIQLLQKKLEHYHTRQSTIAQELHNVMEAQWIEALRIINRDKSPSVENSNNTIETNNEYPKNGPTTNENLEDIKKILATKENSFKTVDIPEEIKYDTNEYIKLKTRHTLTDQIPVQHTSSDYNIFETPVSSKSQTQLTNEVKHHETELQKYIRVLLDNLPRSVSEKELKQELKNQGSSQDSSTSELNDMPTTWQQVSSIKDQERSKDKSVKPPWK